MIIKNKRVYFVFCILLVLTSFKLNQSQNPKKLRKGFEKLVDIQTLDSSIRVDLKYATNDNFMKKRLYFDIDKAYLQKVIAQRFVKCNTYLKKLHPNYRLLVYDAARPRSIQQAMWDALDTIPVKERTKFVSNPANGSVHNYAAAVDLTICDKYGKAKKFESKEEVVIFCKTNRDAIVEMLNDELSKFNTSFKLDSDEGMTLYNCINSSGEGLKPLSDNKCPSDSKPGVKNYTTPQYGLEATVKTLKLNRYECIVKGLREERPPIEISQCDCLKKWGTRDGIYTVLKSNKINPPKINMS